MYMTFTNNISVVKFAGPVQSIELDQQMDNGHFKFDVSFGSHEFGDGQIDFNTGLKYLFKNCIFLKYVLQSTAFSMRIRS